MIAKVTSGGSFRGVLDYLMQPKQRAGQDGPTYDTSNQPRHRLIGGNLAGQTPRELAQEFRAFREQRPEIVKPVHHISLSAAPGERLSEQTWRDIAERYTAGAGYAHSPFVVVRHLDTAHDHIHLVASRIDVRGQVVSDFHSQRRAEEIVREIEREFGLQRVARSRDTARAAPKRGEIEHFNRTGKLSARISLQSHIDLALRDNPTAAEFAARLQQVGVETIPFKHASGRITGMSFRLNGQLMKGSNLGPGYSWPGLQRRGLSYEHERDTPALARHPPETDSRAVIASQPASSALAKSLTQTGREAFTREELTQRLRDAAGLPRTPSQPVPLKHPAPVVSREQSLPPPPTEPKHEITRQQPSAPQRQREEIQTRDAQPGPIRTR